jgi:hypothetical protein
MSLVVVAGELWETPEGFSKPCGKAEGGWWWPAFHRASDPQPGEEGGRGEERVSFPQAEPLRLLSRRPVPALR